MKLGLFTMPLHPPEVPKHEAFQRDVDLLVQADHLGLSEAWIGEHYASVWESVPAPDLLIARALGETSQIKFGTGVACLPHHNPLELAHRIAYLDHLARGRLLFGIGPGGLMVDHDLFCIDTEHDEHRQLTEATIDAVLDVWSGPKDGEWKSDRWHFKVPFTTPFGLGLHLQPYQQPHPPIGVAGVSPGSESLGLASERGWIPLSLNFLTRPRSKTMDGSSTKARTGQVDTLTAQSGAYAVTSMWRPPLSRPGPKLAMARWGGPSASTSCRWCAVPVA